jgi:hypothetical protein
MSFLKPDPPPAIPVPKAPEPTPPVLNPIGSKPSQRSPNRLSFLGGAATGTQPTGALDSGGGRGKTLLGQ